MQETDFTSYVFSFIVHLKSKKCTDKRRKPLIFERSDINSVTDALTGASVSNPTTVDTKKLFNNWIFESLNRRFLDNIISTSELSNKQKGAGNSENNVMLESKGENLPITLEQRISVRKIIEDLIASMLGGSLDDVFVGQLFKNLEYLKIFLLFHTELSKIIHNLEISCHQKLTSDIPISGHEQNPNTSYEKLRKIVQTIVLEVIKLPEFHNQRGFSNVDATQIQTSFEPKVYEDLLATAVINKIVGTYNDKKYENSSGIHSGGSDLDSNFNTERINKNFILNLQSSSTECSSFNERFESTSMKYELTSAVIDEIFREKLEKVNCKSPTISTSSTRSELSDFIQNHKIPSLDTEFRQRFFIDIDDLDDIEPDLQTPHTDSTDVQADRSDISDNWLFRRPLSNNRLNNSTRSVVSKTVSVGMLVPSPTEDCKTLIGDRNIDEISDLSEAGSNSFTDDDDIINNLAVNTDENVNHLQITHSKYDLPHVLLENKTLIGGRNEMSSFEKIKGSFIELLEPDSLVSVQSLNGQSPAISEARNNLILIGEPIKYQNECLTHKIDSSTNTELRMGEFIELDNNESLMNFDSLELDKTDHKNYMDSTQNGRNIKPIKAIRRTDENKNRFAGSFSEREHMKWQNAVELPNNPYSAEALQRRLGQTQTKLINIDGLTGIKNIETVDELAVKMNQTNPNSDVKSMKVVLGPIKLNSARYGRDYYINDSKTASGSREQRTCGDLNLHRAIDDENLENDDDSFVIGDFQVVSDTNPINTSSELRKSKLNIIVNRAEKLDHLCSDASENYFLKTEAVAVDEYTKLSLSSENTDDSHIPPVSLNHSNDSLLTTLSDESECATAVHVYNLSKRETKILRHDIIKRSRIPIGEDLKDPFDSLGNCCGSTNDYNSPDTHSTSVLESTIKDFSDCVTKTIKTDEIKFKGTTVRLKSVHLNRNPHKLKMDNVQLINNSLGTRLDTKDIDELLLNDKYDHVMAENIEIDMSAATEKLIESERDNPCVEPDYDLQKTKKCVDNNDIVNDTHPSDKFEEPKDSGFKFQSEESKVNCAFLVDPIVSEFEKPTEEIHPFKCVQDYELNSDIMVQVSEHKEKSVIEEDVISFLPSVKALAQTFSQQVNKDVSKQLHRPKATYRQPFNNNNENGTGNDRNVENGKPSVETFKHAYYPIAPGYSITARSLSNKFREELRNSTSTLGNTGRLTPERPSSPVLVPGILKNNVAFFENLQNQ